MPEKEPTFLDFFGLSSQEIIKYKEAAYKTTHSDRAKLSRGLLVDKYNPIDNYIANKISECDGILSSTAFAFKLIEIKSWLDKYYADPSTPKLHTWENYISKYFKDPIFCRNPLFFLVYHAAVDTQTKFCFDSCPAPSREETLTGELLAHFKSSISFWNIIASAYLKRSNTTIELSTIDLQIGGLEQRTGGDFAIILEIEDNLVSRADREARIQSQLQKPRGKIIVPIVFQAKRYSSIEVDISQYHDENGYQYDILLSNECSSSYIFYNNDRERIDYPMLPMVKSVKDCLHPNAKKKTHAFDKSIDFSTYILRAISGCPDVKSASSREAALSMMLPSIDIGRLNTVAVVSSKSNAGLEYREMLEELRSRKRNPDADSETESGPQF